MSQTEVQLIKADAVKTADIADDQVTLAKLSASGSPSSSNFLRGDNTFAAAGIGANEKMISVAVDSNITCNAAGGTVFIPGNNSRFHSSNGGPGTNFSGFSIGNSSGIVTFPETGVYLLMFICDGVVTTTDIRSPNIQIYVTQDDSTYVVASQVGCSINRPTGTTSQQNMNTHYIFDVTNTSTHKCKFGFSPDNVGTLFAQADSTMFLTGFHIIKLRDT